MMRNRRSKTIQELGREYLDENHRLWLLRNNPGGYERSIAALNSLMQQVDKHLILLNKPAFIRGLNRFLEKIATAGAVLYLRVS